MRTNPVLVATAVASAVFVAFVCGQTAEATPDDTRPLVLTSFVQRGRTDVYRNEVLQFRFSTALKPGSVDWHSLQVNELIPEGRKPAAGARIVSGNTVRFDPRRSQRNYDESQLPNSTWIEMDRPEGMTGLAAHEVRLNVAPARTTLRSRGGRRLAMPYAATFSTSNVCVDAVPGQPSFIGDHGTGLLGFQPTRSPATGLVSEDAVIAFEFSEPVLSTSLVPGVTVVVRKVTTGQAVAGTVVPDSSAPSGRRFVFVPTGGFGFDTKYGIGWDIDVELTTGITDLAGNSLKRAVKFPRFRTRPPE